MLKKMYVYLIFRKREIMPDHIEEKTYNSVNIQGVLHDN